MHPGQDGVKRLCAARETTICSIFFLTGAWEVVILSERAARARAKDLLLRDVSDGPPRAARARAKDLLLRGTHEKQVIRQDVLRQEVLRQGSSERMSFASVGKQVLRACGAQDDRLARFVLG